MADIVRYFLKKLEQLELHHKVLVFALAIVAAILFVRVGTHFYSPNPVFFGYELHHFDYGMILLVVAVIMLLFGSARRYALCLVLIGVALGLMLDEWWFVRDRVPFSNGAAATGISYQNSAPAVAVLIIVVLLVVLVVQHFQARRKRHGNGRWR